MEWLKQYKYLLLVALVAAMCVAFLVVSRPNKWPTNTKLARTVDGVYDGLLHFALYRPSVVKERLPLVVFIHSGAFVFGSYNDFLITSMAKDFARAGFVTASIEYPKVPSDIGGLLIRRREMEAVASAKKATNYFVDNASSFDIDTSKIFVCGYSAGAIIALHSLFTNAQEASEYVGLGDLPEGVRQALNTPNPFKGIIAISGGVLDMNHVEDADFTCPVLLVHGDRDSIVPFSVGRPFERYMHDYQYDFPGFGYELGIGDETTIQLRESFNVPRSFLRLIRPLFVGDVYGSEAIYNQYGDVDNIDLQLLQIRGGHNFMLTNKGKFTPDYARMRNTIRSFIKEQLR